MIFIKRKLLRINLFVCNFLDRLFANALGQSAACGNFIERMIDYILHIHH
jgi:hypothetical protein